MTLPAETTDQTILLGLETSGRSGSVALLRATREHIGCESELLGGDSGSAKTLAPAISRLLTRTSLAANQLSAIALLTGPGSFTGLRVGVATAKALAYAIRIPILEVDTLDVIASQVSPGHSALHVVLDAYRGQVFHSKYISSQPDIIDHEKYKKVSETSIVDIDALLKRVLEELPLSGSCVLCGPGCDRIRKYLADPENGTSQLTKSQLERVQWLDGPETVPQADTVAKLGYRKLLAGQVLDAFHVNPRYYRGSAAEEKIANSKRS